MASLSTFVLNTVTYIFIIKCFLFLPALFILGHYQALGRVIHMKYLHDQLIEHEEFSFADSRRSMDDLLQQLDILADTLYIKVKRYSAFRLEPFITGSLYVSGKLPTYPSPKILLSEK